MSNGVKIPPTTNENPPQGFDSAWWHPLREFARHVFVATGIFLVVAVPAITLDFFNQGVHQIQFHQSTPCESNPTISNPTSNQSLPHDGSAIVDHLTIRVSKPVSYTLAGMEYLILGVDFVIVAALLMHGCWTYVRTLQWK